MSTYKISKEDLQYQLKTTDKHSEITSNTGIPVWKIEKLIKSYGLQGYRDIHKYECYNSLFDLKSPEFCYLLGLWVTDGYWQSGTLSISLKDKEVLYRLGKHFNCKVYVQKTEGKSTRYVLAIPTRFCDYFHRLGYNEGDKRSSVFLPLVPESSVKYLLRGMIDGDGTIRKGLHNYEIRYFSSNSRLLNNFAYYVKSAGYSLTYHSTKKYGVSTVCVNSLAFMTWLYSDRNDLALDRKLNMVKNKVDDIVQNYSVVKNSSF